MRTLHEYLAFIEKAHVKEIDMGLSRVRKVYEALQLDFTGTRFITVAGTNGKGTTCRFLEQACVYSGLSVGVYASPHIEQFNERIRINGCEAQDHAICAGFAEIENVAATADKGAPIPLTYFEYATLCALVLFSQSTLDVCILEVGLGGRLDATNIIDADIGVITSIGLDHQDYLGNTLEDIAREKAGVIKSKQQVVIGYSSPQNSLLNIAKQQASKMLIRGKDFGQESENKGWLLSSLHQDQETQRLTFDLSAAYIPQQNIMTAIAALDLLSTCLASNHHEQSFKLKSPDFIQGLIAEVSMPGRFEIVAQQPTVILDVAHNEQACELLVSKVEQYVAKNSNLALSGERNRCHIIIGMLKDKNIEDCILVLSHLSASWYCVDLPTARGEKAIRLHQYIENLNQQEDAKPTVDKSTKALPMHAVNSFAKVKDAYNEARRNASLNDVILVVGSFILASEFKMLSKSIIEGNT